MGDLHKSSCARYYGMVLGGQDLEPDDTPEQRFENRLTEDDKKMLKGMHISVEDIT